MKFGSRLGGSDVAPPDKAQGDMLILWEVVLSNTETVLKHFKCTHKTVKYNIIVGFTRHAYQILNSHRFLDIVFFSILTKANSVSLHYYEECPFKTHRKHRCIVLDSITESIDLFAHRQSYGTCTHMNEFLWDAYQSMYLEILFLYDSDFSKGQLVNTSRITYLSEFFNINNVTMWLQIQIINIVYREIIIMFISPELRDYGLLTTCVQSTSLTYLSKFC